jgi:hypothetical protein
MTMSHQKIVITIPGGQRGRGLPKLMDRWSRGRQKNKAWVPKLEDSETG